MTKIKIAIISVLSLMIISSQLISQTVAGYDLSQKIPMKSEVRTGKLPNGLTYFILENRKPENRAELQIVINAGAVHEDDDQKGLAHFIEHMCFNGTKNFPKLELISFLESTGMRFGADVNASTGFDRTYYTLTIPMDKPGLVDKGLQVLEDWLDNVSFDEDEIEKERGVILEEWRLRGNAQMRTFMKHLPYYAWGSKLKDRLPIGDTAIILHAPKEAFTRFYQKYYRPEISAVIAVGDFKADEMEKMIIEKFHDSGKNTPMPKMEDLNLPYNHPPLVSIAKDPELQMPNISIMYKHPATPKGTYGEYRHNMIETIYNMAINQRLQEIGRKPNPPFLYAGGGFSSGGIGQGEALNLVVVPKAENMMAGYETILTEAFRIHKHGITKSELERAKKELLSSMESTFNERDKIESANHAQELYRHFYEGESVPGIAKEFDLMKTFLPTITIEDVNTFAKGLIRDEGMVIMVSAPDKEGIKIPAENDLTSTYRKIESSNIEPYMDVDTDKPLIANLPKPGTIKSKKETKEVGVTEIVLSNGAKVLLKPTDFKNDEIMMTSFSFGGTSLSSDNDYFSASAAANIINQSGIAEFDETTLQKMLTGKQISVYSYIDELTEGVGGSSTPKDLETFFQLVYLYFTAPRKDADAFASYKSKVIESLMNNGLEPNNVFRDSVSAILGGYHLRKMPWTEETIENVSLDKAYEFYKSRFANAGNFTFTIVGNFKVEEMENYLKQYIASLPSTGKADTWKDIGVKTPTNAFRKVVNKGFEPKSSVRLVINGKFDYNRENRFALSSMIELLNIRLREQIREEKGGVYGIYARPNTTLYPKQSYTVNVGFGTGPTRVDELINDAKKVIDEVKAGKFEDTYVDKVKEILKRERETQIKENNFWLSVINQYTYQNEPLTNILEFDKYVAKIDKKYIVEAAKKYLDMNSFKEFILHPEE